MRLKVAINTFLSSRSSAVIYITSLLILVLLGWLDYLTGDYSLIIFYLIPVGLATWYTGKESGLIFSALSFFTRLLADAASISFELHASTMYYWNVFVEFVFLLIMSLLISVLKKNLAK
ncbi:MAG: hypothetical protein WCP33_00475 [Deltaproteobacteria bacterium]